MSWTSWALTFDCACVLLGENVDATQTTDIRRIARTAKDLAVAFMVVSIII